MSFIKIFEGNYHASYYPGWLILGFAFIISFFRFRGTQLLVNRLNILLLSMCMIGVVSTFFDTRMLLRVKEFIPILNVINFGRIDYALSALVFIVLGESMFGFMHFRIPVWFKTLNNFWNSSGDINLGSQLLTRICGIQRSRCTII